MIEKKYVCRECGKKECVSSGAPPLCCGAEMKEEPMEVCTAPPASAEHARSLDDDTPCDDGRGG